MLVIGAGRSGRAAARLLRDRGARVDLYDDAPGERLGDLGAEMEPLGVGLRLGGDRPGPAGYDLAVVSPGVPPRHPLWQALVREGVPVIGEMELGFRHLGCPVVAVTGTNGKTTVAEMIGRALRAAGLRVFLGGNLGQPLSEAAGGDWDLAVVEASSFQLATTRTFRPRVGVLLNLGADHLDWHPDSADYARAKGRLFENQTPDDAAVVNADDPAAWALARRSRAPVLGFSTRRAQAAGAWAEGDDVVLCLPGRDGVRLARGGFRLPGEHNLANGLAAWLAAALAGAEPAGAWEEVQGFPGLPHRLETFLEWRGIRFVDDSKATNVHAALEALRAVGGPVVWVAGGTAKGQDMTPLAGGARGRVRRAVLVGEAAPALARALEAAVPADAAPSWAEAVRMAVDAARPGDTVLLAPACASFDQFSGYAERGETFKRLCRQEAERRDGSRG